MLEKQINEEGQKKTFLAQCIFKETAVLCGFVVGARICPSVIVRAIWPGLFLAPFREE